MTIDKQYRIHRLDPRNITIQKWVVTDKNQSWVTTSYHGNSVKSLVSGLLVLVVQSHTPEDIELSEQLRMMELEVASRLADVEKMVKRYIDDN